MTVADLLLGMVELLVPGLLILGALGWLVNRGRRMSTPREGGGVQTHQQAVHSQLGSGSPTGTGPT
jgi:hypothetical protein